VAASRLRHQLPGTPKPRLERNSHVAAGRLHVCHGVRISGDRVGSPRLAVRLRRHFATPRDQKRYQNQYKPECGIDEHVDLMTRPHTNETQIGAANACLDVAWAVW